MGAAACLRLSLACMVGPSVQGFLPDFQLVRVAVNGLIPKAKHLKRSRCSRVLQEAFLATVAEAAGETIAANQHFSRLVTQAVSQAEMCAVRC